MLTIKNQVRNGSLSGLVFLTSVLLLTACTPPGPRAFLAGKRQLEKGKYPQALENLRTAADLLPTNALVWHYYGIAAQSAGQPAEAEKAYVRALTLNRDFIEARFNLGCLMLDANRPEEAKAQFTAYNLRRGNTALGLSKLGMAQLRLRDVGNAEHSFTEALRLDSTEAEALNGLGMVRLQRGRPIDAAQLFASAVKQQVNYAPALLNLAVVQHQYLRDRQAALRTYREYLALEPLPANATEVAAIASQLSQELSTTPVVDAPAKTAQPSLTNANAPGFAVTTREVGRASPPTQALANTTRPATAQAVSSTAAAPTAPRPSPTNLQTPAVADLKGQSPRVSNPPPNKVEIVGVAPPQTAQVARDETSAGPTPQAAEKSATQPDSPAGGSAAHKRGFFSKINPLNLFGGRDKSATASPTPASSGSKQESLQAAAKETKPSARYSYRYPATPKAGDRQAAQASFNTGVQLHAAKKIPQAIDAYRKATQADPAYFEAHYNLGLALAAQGNFRAALSEYEDALAVRPNSLEARYNLALTLGQAGYSIDSAAEFDTLLMSYPNDVRAHLALGNLYSQKLKDPARARKHYSRVLELEPNHPQAAPIKQWLRTHE